MGVATPSGPPANRATATLIICSFVGCVRVMFNVLPSPFSLLIMFYLIQWNGCVSGPPSTLHLQVHWIFSVYVLLVSFVAFVCTSKCSRQSTAPWRPSVLCHFTVVRVCLVVVLQRFCAQRRPEHPLIFLLYCSHCSHLFNKLWSVPSAWWEGRHLPTSLAPHLTHWSLLFRFLTLFSPLLNFSADLHFVTQVF